MEVHLWRGVCVLGNAWTTNRGSHLMWQIGGGAHRLSSHLLSLLLLPTARFGIGERGNGKGSAELEHCRVEGQGLADHYLRGAAFGMPPQ